MAGKAEYKNKWISEKCDRVNLILPKGRKSQLQAHAGERKESLNGFVNRAIDCQIERDNHTQEPPVTTVQEPGVTTTQEPCRNDASTAQEPNVDIQEPNVVISNGESVDVSTQEPPVNAGSELRKAAIVTGESQAKPTGKPSQELIESWLSLSASGISGERIAKMPESGGWGPTTIKKYLRLAREAVKEG